MAVRTQQHEIRQSRRCGHDLGQWYDMMHLEHGQRNEIIAGNDAGVARLTEDQPVLALDALENPGTESSLALSEQMDSREHRSFDRLKDINCLGLRGCFDDADSCLDLVGDELHIVRTIP